MLSLSSSLKVNRDLKLVPSQCFLWENVSDGAKFMLCLTSKVCLIFKTALPSDPLWSAVSLFANTSGKGGSCFECSVSTLYFVYICIKIYTSH